MNRCYECNGEGFVWDNNFAGEGQMRVPCPHCHGAGILLDEEDTNDQMETNG